MAKAWVKPSHKLRPVDPCCYWLVCSILHDVSLGVDRFLTPRGTPVATHHLPVTLGFLAALGCTERIQLIQCQQPAPDVTPSQHVGTLLTIKANAVAFDALWLNDCLPLLALVSDGAPSSGRFTHDSAWVIVAIWVKASDHAEAVVHAEVGSGCFQHGWGNGGKLIRHQDQLVRLVTLHLFRCFLGFADFGCNKLNTTLRVYL